MWISEPNTAFLGPQTWHRIRMTAASQGQQNSAENLYFQMLHFAGHKNLPGLDHSPLDFLFLTAKTVSKGTGEKGRERQRKREQGTGRETHTHHTRTHIHTHMEKERDRDNRDRDRKGG